MPQNTRAHSRRIYDARYTDRSHARGRVQRVRSAGVRAYSAYSAVRDPMLLWLPTNASRTQDGFRLIGVDVPTGPCEILHYPCCLGSRPLAPVIPSRPEKAPRAKQVRLSFEI